MTQRYITVLLAFLSLSAAMAQGFVSITNEEGQVVNGTVIYRATPPDAIRDTVKLNTTLSPGGAAMSVNIRRYELWPVDGTFNFFCWGVCYIPQASGAIPTWVSQHPIDMQPGGTVNDFAAYYEPTGQAGTAMFRYVWFPTNDPGSPDSVWVDIQFGGQVGMDEQAAAVRNMSLFPNPSAGADITITYQLDQPGSGVDLVVYDLLGQRVLSRSLGMHQDRVVLGAGRLSPGVYFVNVERNGRMLATRRLVVSH
jgi:hypothetical protein